MKKILPDQTVIFWRKGKGVRSLSQIIKCSSVYKSRDKPRSNLCAPLTSRAVTFNSHCSLSVVTFGTLANTALQWSVGAWRYECMNECSRWICWNLPTYLVSDRSPLSVQLTLTAASTEAVTVNSLRSVETLHRSTVWHFIHYHYSLILPLPHASATSERDRLTVSVEKSSSWSRMRGTHRRWTQQGHWLHSVVSISSLGYDMNLKKNIPDIFSCNSRKHYRIFVILKHVLRRK